MEFAAALMCGFVGAICVAAFVLDVIMHASNQKPARHQSHSAHLLAGGMLVITAGLYVWAAYEFPYAYTYETSLDGVVMTTHGGWLYTLVTLYSAALAGLLLLAVVHRNKSAISTNQ